jgi:hypothetical protein
VRRPYDLRHAALSLWLASGAPPAEVAARAGHSAHVLLTVYAHCIPGHDQIASQHIAQALRPRPGTRPASGPENPYHPGRSRPSCVRVTAGLNGTRLDLPGPATTASTAGDLRKQPRDSSALGAVTPIGVIPAFGLSRPLTRPDLAHHWPTTTVNGLTDRPRTRIRPGVRQDRYRA